MPRKDRERWRMKQKAKQREEYLNRKTESGSLDLTPHNAVAGIKRPGAEIRFK